VRVAEEYSTLDVISRGRVEMGFVKGAPFEVTPANSNPADLTTRFWEAHDLILKALSTHDGPFTWEGEYYQYRNVNIWPRAIQEPHPPVWINSQSPNSARGVAERGYVTATFLLGLPAREVFATYRKRYAEVFRRAPAADRLGYAAMIAVSKDRSEAARKAEEMRGYLKSLPRSAEPFKIPPGYGSVADFGRLLRGPNKGRVTESRPHSLPDGRSVHHNASDDELAQIGMLFSGTPDDIFNQIKAFHKYVGGFGHLMIMAQAGSLNHADTVENLELFAKEVYPRLGELNCLHEMPELEPA